MSIFRRFPKYFTYPNLAHKDQIMFADNVHSTMLSRIQDFNISVGVNTDKM
jgi:hypothetical protein